MLTLAQIVMVIMYQKTCRCELVFVNCFVPEENVLGQEGKGIKVGIGLKNKLCFSYMMYIFFYLNENRSHADRATRNEYVAVIEGL